MTLKMKILVKWMISCLHARCPVMSQEVEVPGSQMVTIMYIYMTYMTKMTITIRTMITLASRIGDTWITTNDKWQSKQQIKSNIVAKLLINTEHFLPNWQHCHIINHKILFSTEILISQIIFAHLVKLSSSDKLWILIMKYKTSNTNEIQNK